MYLAPHFVVSAGAKRCGVFLAVQPTVMFWSKTAHFSIQANCVFGELFFQMNNLKFRSNHRSNVIAHVDVINWFPHMGVG